MYLVKKKLEVKTRDSFQEADEIIRAPFLTRRGVWLPGGPACMRVQKHLHSIRPQTVQTTTHQNTRDIIDTACLMNYIRRGCWAGGQGVPQEGRKGDGVRGGATHARPKKYCRECFPTQSSTSRRHPPSKQNPKNNETRSLTHTIPIPYRTIHP